MLEPSFKGLESSAAAGHRNISDLHNSVYTSGGMTVNTHNNSQINMHEKPTSDKKINKIKINLDHSVNFNPPNFSPRHQPGPQTNILLPLNCIFNI